MGIPALEGGEEVRITEVLMPWTVSGVFFATTLGADLDFLPWAVFNWSGVVFSSPPVSGSGHPAPTPAGRSGALTWPDAAEAGECGHRRGPIGHRRGISPC